jgi:RNase H-like domain found in reverse transcriptase/Integrase zinc binding domain/Reverse transcriptase (RNA-dependent DNA polymerase)/Integrase core domain/Retroviral aspartyl protease
MSDQNSIQNITLDSQSEVSDYIILQIGPHSGLVRVQATLSRTIEVDIVLDSASSTSIISTELVNPSKIKPLPHPIRLAGVSPSLVQVRGSIIVPITIQGITIFHKFLCLDNFKYSILCGNDFLLPQKIVLDFNQRIVKWREESIPMEELITKQVQQNQQFSCLQLNEALIKLTNSSVTRHVNLLNTTHDSKHELQENNPPAEHGYVPSQKSTYSDRKDTTLTTENLNGENQQNESQKSTYSDRKDTTLTTENLKTSPTLNSFLNSSTINTQAEELGNVLGDKHGLYQDDSLQYNEHGLYQDDSLQYNEHGLYQDDSLQNAAQGLYRNDSLQNNEERLNQQNEELLNNEEIIDQQELLNNETGSYEDLNKKFYENTYKDYYTVFYDDNNENNNRSEKLNDNETSRTIEEIMIDNIELDSLITTQVSSQGDLHSPLLARRVYEHKTSEKVPISSTGEEHLKTPRTSLARKNHSDLSSTTLTDSTCLENDIPSTSIGNSCSNESRLSTEVLQENSPIIQEDINTIYKPDRPPRHFEKHYLELSADMKNSLNIDSNEENLKTKDTLRIGDKTFVLPPSEATIDRDLSMYDEPTQEHIKTILARINPESTPTFKKQMEELLIEYQDIFSRPGEYPTTIKDHQHVIKTKPGVKLTKQNPIPKPKELMDFERNTIRQLLKDGQIEYSGANHACRVLIVPKKGPKKYRFIVDLRQANKAIEDSAFPITTIEVIFQWLLNRHKHMSTLDLTSAYYQVELAPESRELLTFVSFEGLFQPTRVFFGAKDSARAFLIAMNKVFKGLLFSHLNLYIDDIIFADNTEEEHLYNLRIGFQRMRKHNVKLEAWKANFNFQKLAILGNIIDQTGVHLNPEKVIAVLNAPHPTTVRSLQRFLGSCNWFRRSIPHLSVIAGPLYELLQADRKFIWGTKQQEAFDEIKKILTSPPLLHWFRDEDKTILVTDASINGIGAALLQIKENKRVVPIAYYSASLNKAQTRYPAIHLEYLAFATGVRKFHPYLYGRHFTAYTDSLPNAFAQTTPKNRIEENRLQGWKSTLSAYDFDLLYRPGPYNELSDWLSRDTSPSNTVDEQILDTDQVRISNPFVEENETCLITEIADLAETQKVDTRCQEIIRLIELNDARTISKYKILEELLVNIHPGYPRPYIPKILVPTILAEMHNSPVIGGHSGFNRTLTKIQQKFYWETMKKDTFNYVNACESCLALKRNYGKIPGMPGRMLVPKYPTQYWSVDIVGPFNSSTKSNLYIINAVCMLSKWSIWKPTASTSAETVAKFFESNIFFKFGIPEQIVVDNGPQFISKLLHSHAKLFQFKLRNTSLYNSRSNSIVERNHQTAVYMIKHYLEKDYSHWDQKLEALNFCYNISPHKSLGGKSPFEVLYGRPPKFPNEFKLDQPENDTEFDLIEHKGRLQKIWDFVRITIKKQQDSNCNDLAKGHRTVNYEPGDRVKIQFPKTLKKLPNVSNKWTPYFFGEYIIKTKLNDLTYTVQDVDTQRIFLCHVRRIKPIGLIPLDEEDEIADIFISREQFIENITNISRTIQILKNIEFIKPDNYYVYPNPLILQIYDLTFYILQRNTAFDNIDTSKFTQNVPYLHIFIDNKITKIQPSPVITYKRSKKSMSPQFTNVHISNNLDLNSWKDLVKDFKGTHIILGGDTAFQLIYKYTLAKQIDTILLPPFFHLALKLLPYCEDKSDFYKMMATMAIELLDYARTVWHEQPTELQFPKESEKIIQRSDNSQASPIIPEIEPQLRRSARQKQPPKWTNDFIL